MRVERTFAFVDLVGFTAFTEAQGDQCATDVLADFRSTVRRVASDQGVRVAKWLGDGAMFVAVDTPPLVTAVLDVLEQMERATLSLRAGMAGGPVILFEGDDHIGTAVNLAARLCDVARPGTALATPDVCTRLPPGARSSDAGTVALHGFAHPIPVQCLELVHEVRSV